MSAQRLRDAAKVLRERAEDATPGPWIAEYSKKSGHCVIDAESRNALDSVARATHFRDVGDATFIATMHPGVALALADWLDVAGADHFAFGDPVHHAADHEPCWDCDDDPRAPHMRASLRVADLILGSQP